MEGLGVTVNGGEGLCTVVDTDGWVCAPARAGGGTRTAG